MIRQPTSLNIAIRSAEAIDAPLILNFIKEKAVFDSNLDAFSGILQATETTLQETLFNSAPFAKVILAEVLPQQAIGFALYYFRYSSFRGRPSLWLDDLYIDAGMRGQGIGTMLFQHLIEIAQTHQCSHLGWTAHQKNDPGVRFYQKMGATLIEQRDSTLYFQVDLA
jgi:GNAT superfamily N-acetyltransferase